MVSNDNSYPIFKVWKKKWSSYLETIRTWSWQRNLGMEFVSSEDSSSSTRISNHDCRKVYSIFFPTQIDIITMGPCTMVYVLLGLLKNHNENIEKSKTLSKLQLTHTWWISHKRKLAFPKTHVSLLTHIFNQPKSCQRRTFLSNNA